MGIVYCIECLETGEKYIGSTTQPLKKRMTQHTWDAKNGKLVCSKQIIDRGNYTSYIIEEVNLLEREQYHIDNTECINVHRALGFDKKEYNTYYKNYYQANREKIIGVAKEYNKANKEKISEKSREKITCECGAIYCRGDKTRHMKTKKHAQGIISK